MRSIMARSDTALLLVLAVACRAQAPPSGTELSRQALRVQVFRVGIDTLFPQLDYYDDGVAIASNGGMVALAWEDGRTGGQTDLIATRVVDGGSLDPAGIG